MYNCDPKNQKLSDCPLVSSFPPLFTGQLPWLMVLALAAAGPWLSCLPPTDRGSGGGDRLRDAHWVVAKDGGLCYDNSLSSGLRKPRFCLFCLVFTTKLATKLLQNSDGVSQMVRRRYCCVLLCFDPAYLV